MAISSGRSKPAPSLVGTKMPLFIPRPQPQVPNRTGMGVPLAQAVPLLFRKLSRIGSPTVTATPPTMPLNTRRLVNLLMSDSLAVRKTAVTGSMLIEGNSLRLLGRLILRYWRRARLHPRDLRERVAQSNRLQQIRNPITLVREALVEICQQWTIDWRRNATCAIAVHARHQATRQRRTVVQRPCQ